MGHHLSDQEHEGHAPTQPTGKPISRERNAREDARDHLLCAMASVLLMQTANSIRGEVRDNLIKSRNALADSVHREGK